MFDHPVSAVSASQVDSEVPSFNLTRSSLHLRVLRYLGLGESGIRELDSRIMVAGLQITRNVVTAAAADI